MQGYRYKNFDTVPELEMIIKKRNNGYLTKSTREWLLV